MADYKKIGNMSGKVLLIASVSYFINYISNGFLQSIFSLSSNSILNNFEAWRLFTYPLAGTSLESYLLFFFTFLAISPKLEKSFKKPYYLFFILLICCLQGTLAVLYFNSSGLVITGTEGISFFVLTLFTLLNFNKKIMLYNLKPIKTTVFASALSFLWLLSVSAHSFLFKDFNILNTSGFSAGFGIAAAILIFAEMKFLERMKAKKTPEVTPEIDIPKPEELAMAYSQTKIESKRINQILRENRFRYYEDEDFTEDHLNSLLDKMNENGKDSLSFDEIEFLKQYSQRI